MTVMKILERNEFLTSIQMGSAYVYRPSQPKRQVVAAMVRDFINRVFIGNTEPLLTYTCNGSHAFSHEEVGIGGSNNEAYLHAIGSYR